MKVVFRVDASFEIGSGHTMRCLTLADALKDRGHYCEFIVREQPGHLIALIEEKGYLVHALPLPESVTAAPDEYVHSHWLPGGQQQDSEDTLAVLQPNGCDWLVVDHYGVGAPWETLVRKACRHVLVIDDLADRAHQCDILLDQNMGRRADDYDKLVPKECVRLIGPQYALLRPEFAKWREESLSRRRQRTELRQLLISLGGVDKDNVTGDVLDALEASSLPDSVTMTVVLGQQNPWLEKIQQQAASSRFKVTVKQGVSNMAELMSQADVAIGAAGSTSWERCSLGLPTIMLVLAENQEMVGRNLVEQGAVLQVDAATIKSSENLEIIVDKLWKNARLIAERAASVTNGAGYCKVIGFMSRFYE